MIARAIDLKTRIANLSRRFMKERAGNIAMTFAIVSVPLLAAIGASIDYAQLVNSQRHLQDAIDAAAVSAAASLVSGKHTDTTVKDYAVNFVMAELSPTITTAEAAQLKSQLAFTVTSSGTGSKKTYALKVSGGYTAQLSPFAKFIGYGTMPIAASSSTESQAVSKNAMSMFLVLDRSGSMSFVTNTSDTNKNKCQNYVTMSDWAQYPYLATSKPCYINKMGAVKTAAATLMDELDALEAVDTTDTVVRVGGVSFHDEMQTAQPIAWGTTSLRNYVTALPAYPSGGTDMTDSMKKAYNSLIDSSEGTAHTAKGNTTFSKFIVLMTDGENTGNSAVWNPGLDTVTLGYCTDAKKAGITIFTVAFMAPANGEDLLKKCASATSNYYSANDMASLIKAFADIGAKAVKQATRITS